MRLGMHSGVSSLAGSTNSVLGGHDIYGEDDSMQPGSFEPMFRGRANSSIQGSSSRVTPSMDHPSFDDFDFPPWVDATAPLPGDIVDRTDQVSLLRLILSNLSLQMTLNSNRSQMGNGVKQEQKPQIKTEPNNAPTTYQELNSVRCPSQFQNPLLRNHHLSKYQVPSSGLVASSSPCLKSTFRMNMYQSYWQTQSVQPMSTPHSCAAQQSVSASVGSALPIDLENLTLPDQPLMEMDVESLLRHELSQTRDHQINFDI